MLLKNALFPYDNSFVKRSILVDGGQIASIDEALPADTKDQIIDCDGLYVLPGFIDMHIHGWGGFDAMDGNKESIQKIADQLAQFGVTSFLATTFTHAKQTTLAALKAIRDARAEQTTGAQILGAHLEGPCISTKAKGAQPDEHIRPASKEEYQEWLDLKIVKEATVAPEIAENKAFIRDCVANGIVVSVGHSDATYDQVLEAVALGATQSTHTFNGMKGIHHREPGTAGAALTEDKIYCEVIADLLHLHPATVKLVLLAKGVSKTILITDAVSAAGLPEGTYTVLDDKARVNKDGRITTVQGSLSGSSLTMDQALRNVMQLSGKTIKEVWPISSQNAAKQLKVKKGEIKVGYDADFVVLNKDYEVEMTISLGKVIYKKVSVL